MAASLDGLRIPRFLTQNKAFAACVVFSLGVGISVSTGVVAVVDSARNGKVPFAYADRLEVVYVGGRQLKDRSYSLQLEVAQALNGPGSPFEDAAVWRYGTGDMRLGERSISAPMMVEATPNLPRLLSARMHIGRPFGVSDSPDERHLMLSHAYWTENFSSDSTIVGRTVFADSVPHVVTGVTAPEWRFPEGASAWKSTTTLLTPAGARDSRVSMVGLRKPGIDVGHARAMTSTIGTRAMTLRPGSKDRIESQSFRDFLTLHLSRFLYVLGVVALFIGLITAVNFAALVLARGIKRRVEIGVRAALGASVGRLVTHILGETVWFTAAGGILAAMLAPGVLNVVRLTFENSLPAWLEITLSWRIVAASVTVSFLIGTIFSLGPALDLARPALGTFLRGAGVGLSGSSRAVRSRAGLVSVQVGLATAFLVLFGALLGRALVMTRPDPGYEYGSIIRGSIARDRNIETAMLGVLGSVEQTGGVARAAVSHTRMLSSLSAVFEGASGDAIPFMLMWHTQVSESFFDVVRPKIVAGRLPTSEEFRGRAPVAVVSDVVARRFFESEAIGKTIRIDGVSLTIVGVVEKLERGAASVIPSATIHSPIVARPNRSARAEIWIRVGDPSRVQPLLRDLRQRSTLDVLGGRVRLEALSVTMREEMREFWAVVRIVYSIFGIAIVLAAMGIYGLVSYTVEMRNREMAIREALGASRTRVAALLLRTAAVQTLIGLAGGAALATALATQIRQDGFVLTTAASSTVVAFIIVLLTVLVSSFSPLRATWRRDLSHVLRD